MKRRILVLALLVAAAFAGTALAQEAVPPAPEDELTQEQKIEKLIGELGSDDWAVREAATKELARIGLPAAEAVEKLLESDDMELRIRAKKILAALRYVSKEDKEKIERQIDLCLWGGEAKELDEATKKLIEDLSSEDWQTREDAVKELSEKGLQVLRAVAKLLDTDDPDLKERVERVVKSIKEKAKTEMEEQLKKSVEALKEVKCASYALVDLLKTKGEKPREEIISKLLVGIAELKSDQDDGNTVIIRPGKGGVVISKTVVVINGKKRTFVNGEEVTGLGKNPSPEKVLSAIAADEKKEMELRLESLKAIEAREAAKAVTDLVKLLGKCSGELQLETARVLRKLTGQEFGPAEGSTLEENDKAVEEWKKWLEENKENEKYRFSEQPADNDGGAIIQLGQNAKQLEEMRKKVQEAMKKAMGEVEKPEEKPEEKEKPTEPEKKESEPEKKKEEEKSRDF